MDKELTKVIEDFDRAINVEALRLAKEISRVSQAKQTSQPILLQVKLAPDPDKSGFAPNELKEAIAEILSLPGIECKGLMTITPQNASGELRKQCFAGLKDLRDGLEQQTGASLPELSMGMSDDWQEALACGSTMLRIGTAIFHV